MISIPNDPLDLAILLYQELKSINIVNRNVSGFLPDSFDYQLVVKLLQDLDLLVTDNQSERTIEFSLPMQNSGIFFFSLEDILRVPSRRIMPPQRFYIADIKYKNENHNNSVPDIIQNYFVAAQLFQLLKCVADYVSNEGGVTKLIFLQRDKLIITPDYSINDLQSRVDISRFENDFIKSEIHKEQKITILKTVLFELFKDDINIPLSALIMRFDIFWERIKSSYQLYVAEFSFEKIKSVIESFKLESTNQLNKVFSDIQNQLLAVPVALIVAGGQMDNVGKWIVKNVIIWLGVFIYSILMDLLIRNQQNTLQAVKDGIEYQKKLIEGKYNFVADNFRDSYNQLDKRHIHQIWLIRIVSGLVAFSLLITTSMLLWYSVPEIINGSLLYLKDRIL